MSDDPPETAFWNRVARRYAAAPMRRPEDWERTLDRVRVRLAPEARVLELGCGTGSTALRLAPCVTSYTGTDAASEMIAIARERLAETPADSLSFETARCGDGSLPEGPFDAVLAFNLLHLLPDLPAALAEARTRLRPGGVLITKTPCLGGPWNVFRPLVAALKLAGQAPPFRFVRPARLEAEIAAAGFEIVERGDYPARPPSRFVVARKDGAF